MLKVQWIAYAVSFISAYAMPATVPVLPALAEEFAMPESSMGLLMAAFTLPCILLTPLFGILADRVSPAHPAAVHPAVRRRGLRLWDGTEP